MKKSTEPKILPTTKRKTAKSSSSLQKMLSTSDNNKLQYNNRYSQHQTKLNKPTADT